MAKTVIYNNAADASLVYEAIDTQIGIDDNQVIEALKTHLSQNLSTSGSGYVTDVEYLQEFILAVINRARSVPYQ